MIVFAVIIVFLLLFFLTKRFFQRKRARIYAAVKDFWFFAKLIFSNKKVFGALMVLSLLGQLFGAIAVFFVGVSLGAQITLTEMILVMPSVYLLLTIPLSIGGWGAREALLVFALGVFGTSAAHAILIGVIYGAIKIIVSVPSIAPWFFRRKML